MSSAVKTATIDKKSQSQKECESPYTNPTQQRTSSYS